MTAKTFCLAAAICVACMPIEAQADAQPSAGVEIVEATGYRYVVNVNGERVTEFRYDPAAKKPCLYPLLGPGGRAMTRGYPLEEIPGEPTDHAHHRSLYIAYGDVNGVDCWSEGEGSGVQRVRNVEATSGQEAGTLTAHCDWLDNEGRPIIAETRQYTFHNTPDTMRVIDSKVTFDARYGPVTFGDTKEGGLCAIRVNPLINGNAAGTLGNSTGLIGEASVWGKPAAWVCNSGPIDGATCGVAIFDTPTNPRYPTTWHARGYGLVTANPFGLSYFTDGQVNGDLRLEEGETLTFQYRIVIFEGDVESASIADHYREYVDAR